MHSAVNNVIYALRRNQNWSIHNSYKSFKLGTNDVTLLSEDMELLKDEEFRLREEELLKNFTILKFTDSAHDPMKILFPFLEIIKAGYLTGSVTLAAIDGIDKLLEMEIINFKHANIIMATNDLVIALTRCKFEATDSVNDELVLYSILKLLRKISKKIIRKVDRLQHV